MAEESSSLSKGVLMLRAPGMNPAYFGVGYIIGPKLGAINFSGGVLAWGLLTPIIAFFIHRDDPGAVTNWTSELTFVWKNYVRYIAIGGMLVGAFYTLYKMRNSLFTGIDPLVLLHEEVRRRQTPRSRAPRKTSTSAGRSSSSDSSRWSCCSSSITSRTASCRRRSRPS